MDSKYKIEIIEGCTAFDTVINDKSLMDHSNEEVIEIVDYLLVKIKEAYLDNTVLFDDLVKIFPYDEYEHDDYRCEQCGDTVSTTIWNI